MGIRLLCCAILLLAFHLCQAQPMARDQRQIMDVGVFPDFHDNSVFYYAPGELSLAYEPGGKPKFQLLEMRYTGSAATGNSGEKRFMNVVQFTVTMEQISAEKLEVLKQRLGGVDIKLRPVPIRSIEAILVAPVGDPNASTAYTRVGHNGSFQAGSHEGAPRGDGYWTERTFTVKLENHEAQLLWDQVDQGHLALSLAYSFYADIIPGTRGAIEVGGDKSYTDSMESRSDEMLVTDTIATVQAIRADAFPVRVDTQKWPDILKKIDLNEGIPPAYAALEVRCYDFSDDLRPDLAIKSVEIQATGVGGTAVVLPPQKFFRSQPDLNGLQIHFPYAVKLTEPFRYRVIEYTLEGTRGESPWITSDSWAGVLDITTPEAARRHERKSIDVELPSLAEHSLSVVDVVFHYIFRGYMHEQVLRFDASNELPIQQSNITLDQGTDLYYEAIWKFEDGSQTTTERSRAQTIDDYLYLPIPAKKVAVE
ncbi:MAG TPA: hypothetical protein VKZ75_03400 [Cyclobacteriaceae bacterium]|nr:hypothetical protein [Cyclobacteriaceae bacterium]